MTLASRRTVLSGAAALPLVSIRTRPARAAEWTFKMANNVPVSHPISVRMQEASARIKELTGGRLEIQVFPNNQLGSDTDMLSQLRSGALEFFTLSGLILSTLVPNAAIHGLGFIFKDYDAVWHAMDGALGTYVRSEIAKRGIIALPKIWDNGFRMISSSTRPIRTPEDLKGFKIRVPVSPLWTSMFQAFGAAPASINFSEVYSALQTKIVEGQENPLTLIELAKLYEVQKYISMTGHMWDGYWLLANGKKWAALPQDVQDIAARELDKSALDERSDVLELDKHVSDQLKSQGIEFVQVNREQFRDVLKKSGFYKTWQEKFGPQAWGVLESEVGALT